MSKRFSSELMLRIHNRDTELQRAFDRAVSRRDELTAEIDKLTAERAQMRELIEKCYDRAAEQGVSWAL